MHPRWGGVSREEWVACSGCRLGAQQQCVFLVRAAERQTHCWVLRQHRVVLAVGSGWWCRFILVVGCGVCLLDSGCEHLSKIC